MNRTYEGIVANGQIQIVGDVKFPENTRVFVVVPNEVELPSKRVATPRLVHPEHIIDFQMEVIDEAPDAGL